MSLRPYEVRSSTILSDNPFLPLVEELCILPHNGRSIRYYRMGPTKDWVSIVPFTKEGRLVIVRTYRHGARVFCEEPPAGLVEKGEAPSQTARRELREETGFAPGKLVHMESSLVDPAIRSNSFHVFVGSGCRKVGGPSPESSEDLEVALVSPKNFLRKLLTERNANSRAVHALLLAKNRFPHFFK